MFRLRSICNVSKELKTFSTKVNLNERTNDKIVIPKRIKRSPTCILHALARTVGRDNTAPHYKFIDDPFLIPLTGANKFRFALAMESGRRAARWVKQQHSNLFEVGRTFGYAIIEMLNVTKIDVFIF